MFEEAHRKIGVARENLRNSMLPAVSEELTGAFNQLEEEQHKRMDALASVAAVTEAIHTQNSVIQQQQIEVLDKLAVQSDEVTELQKQVLIVTQRGNEDEMAELEKEVLLKIKAWLQQHGG